MTDFLHGNTTKVRMNYRLCSSHRPTIIIPPPVVAAVALPRCHQPPPVTADAPKCHPRPLPSSTPTVAKLRCPQPPLAAINHHHHLCRLCHHHRQRCHPAILPGPGATDSSKLDGHKEKEIEAVDPINHIAKSC